ncbi:hypothetical protein QWJ26_27395 [Streptomyces sp. CSDS2]|uniref:hypothetical protein n=1 Tax=Streptomyces sp. CSDS2 TaxID=3055051 RepID=UPI0025B18A45|nr:hypothetical protein [Streptomyces sp. CSDS2]MDN3263471.1 hypothetical protein [Streptomyces sp. CSDS2]
MPLVLSSIGLGVIVAAVLAWQFFVHALSDPTPLAVGIRIDGTQVAIKVATCPTETVDKVEVFDGDTEERLWAARTPKSPEGKRGALSLWAADEYEHPGSGQQPKPLPRRLDILLTQEGGDGGGGGVVDTAAARAANVPNGQYWTANGLMSAEAIDGQLTCDSSE